MMDVLRSQSSFLLIGSFLFVTLLSFLVRFISIKVGFISIPKKDRWNPRVVALGGGIAILCGILLGSLFLGGKIVSGIVPSVFLVFALGLVDDIWGVKPLTKLMIQTLAAAYVVSCGYLLPLPSVLFAIPITIIWLVGISNSVNLLDNMDGLAAGICAFAALGFSALFGLRFSDSPHQGLAMIVAGSTLGFLVHNFNPAKIFMGDAGSLPLGFILGILATQVHPIGDLPAYVSPLIALLVLVIPLFDTTLVMAARRTAGRPLMAGGRDHCSHRIVALGLTERRAVLVLYLLGATSSAAAWVMAQSYSGTFTLLSVGALGFFGLLWVFLIEIGVYSTGGAAASPNYIAPREPLSLPLPVLYFLEIIFDICVIVFVWTAAHMVRFQGENFSVFSDYMVISVIPRLPQLIVVKLAAFSIFRLYRGVWRAISMDDVRQIFKAVTLATTVLVVGSAFKTRLYGLSRIVIVLDWLLTFVMILGSRTAYSLLRGWTSKLASESTKAALLGSSSLISLLKAAVQKEKGLVLMGAISNEQGHQELGETSSELVLGPVDELTELISQYKINVLFVLPGSLETNQMKSLISQGVSIRELTLHVT